MARSRRKSPVTGFTTAESEHRDKLYWVRSLRTRLRAALYRGDEVLPEPKRGGYGEKDGKMRFDPDEHPKLMRK